MEKETDVIQAFADAIEDLKNRVAELESRDSDNVELKDSTGDFSSNNFMGRRVINTFDNTYKIYAEGSWRSIASW